MIYYSRRSLLVVLRSLAPIELCSGGSFFAKLVYTCCNALRWEENCREDVEQKIR
jgi:hypothetical protein